MSKEAKWALTILVLITVAGSIVCYGPANEALPGVKQGNVVTNTPQAIDGAVRKVMEEMPPITVGTASFVASTSVGMRLSYDYGSSDRYQVLVSWVTNAGASFDLRAVKVDGDSVHFFRTGASNGVISVMTAPNGTWGK